MPVDRDHPQAIKRREGDVRRLLNEWDFIGVADQVHDEYDCLIEPLLTRLTAVSTAEDLTAFVRHELGDHFGIDPAYADVPRDVDGLLTLAATWRTTDGPVT